MELSKEQVHNIASNIFINDIIEYINSHSSEYEEFLKNEQKGGKNGN